MTWPPGCWRCWAATCRRGRRPNWAQGRQPPCARSWSGSTRWSAAAGGRWHPVFMLCRRAVLPGLEDYLARGGRRIEDWVRGQRHAVVEFADAAAAEALIGWRARVGLEEGLARLVEWAEKDTGDAN